MRWVVLGLSAALLGLLVLTVSLYASLAQVRSELDVACNGIIAGLDLTEWVSLCRDRT